MREFVASFTGNSVRLIYLKRIHNTPETLALKPKLQNRANSEAKPCFGGAFTECTSKNRLAHIRRTKSSGLQTENECAACWHTIQTANRLIGKKYPYIDHP
eukprot:GEMP01100990.1.p2 GENE.GEMP01100990.1~~GEMP01100990.1.p2  ORF type:complete len:101 (-),score=9.96 GEMP01100990.1:172-474(-)